jgi:hypothetical protein
MPWVRKDRYISEFSLCILSGLPLPLAPQVEPKSLKIISLHCVAWSVKRWSDDERPIRNRFNCRFKTRKIPLITRHHWLMPIILAAQEAEIRRITVPSQPRHIVLKTASWQKSITKKSWWSDRRCKPWVQTLIPQKKKECHLWFSLRDFTSPSLKWL